MDLGSVCARYVAKSPRQRLTVCSDGELTVKRFYQLNGVVKLVAENPEYADLELKDGQEMVIWGVVTRIIKSV